MPSALVFPTTTGLVFRMSGAVVAVTRCCRPPALLARLVRRKEYWVSGSKPVISFWVCLPSTSTDWPFPYSIWRQHKRMHGFSWLQFLRWKSKQQWMDDTDTKENQVVKLFLHEFQLMDICLPWTREVMVSFENLIKFKSENMSQMSVYLHLTALSLQDGVKRIWHKLWQLGDKSNTIFFCQLGSLADFVIFYWQEEWSFIDNERLEIRYLAINLPCVTMKHSLSRPCFFSSSKLIWMRHSYL